MKVYGPNEVADLLGIKTATLRKYSILLEKQGYRIERNSRNHRYYQDKDIMTIRSVIRGAKSGATLEESISNVINLKGYSDNRNDIDSDIERNNNDIQELKEMIHKQNELLKGFSTRLDEQQQYIDNQLKERDKVLMQSINEIMESKKQIATAEQKKGFFRKLFNRG